MTQPHLIRWPNTSGFRRSEVTAVIGRGDDAWSRAAHDVLRWKVKTRSGFAVDTTTPVAVGERLTITARVFWVSVDEPVEVVSVVQTRDRVGFAYRALPGHPVSGEETFIVHRAGDVVMITIRSLTRPATQQPWRALFPLLRIAQVIARRRYLRALR